jgi:hypothetical protein
LKKRQSIRMPSLANSFPATAGHATSTTPPALGLLPALRSGTAMRISSGCGLRRQRQGAQQAGEQWGEQMAKGVFMARLLGRLPPAMAGALARS